MAIKDSLSHRNFREENKIMVYSKEEIMEFTNQTFNEKVLNHHVKITLDDGTILGGVVSQLVSSYYNDKEHSVTNLVIDKSQPALQSIKSMEIL